MSVSVTKPSTALFTVSPYPLTELLTIQLSHGAISCPFCGDSTGAVTTWGAYKTESGEIRRYHCHSCKKTFNATRIPELYHAMSTIAFKLAQLVLKEGVSVNSLAEDLGVPEPTLRAVMTEIRSQLALHLETIKALQTLQVPSLQKISHAYRIVYYDEGFHRLLGGQYYLVFVVDHSGTPLQVDLVPFRDQAAVAGCLQSAATRLGGIDVIVADGAPAVTMAIKELALDVILVQHIHSGTGKRVRVVKYSPLPGSKRIREVTVEMHSGSLHNYTESVIRVREQLVYACKSKRRFQHQDDPQLKKKLLST
jgi:transposase-like protein